MLWGRLAACAGGSTAIYGQEGLAMKRLLVLFAVLVPLSLFIAGCGGRAGSSGAASGPPPKEQMQKMEQAQKEMMQKNMPGAPGAPGAKK